MNQNSNDDPTRVGYDPSRRSFLASAMAAGLGATTLMGLSSVLPIRAFAAGGVSAGTVIYGNSEPPTSNYWDPAVGMGLVDEQVASLVHDTLIAFDESGAMVPSIATKWTITSPTSVALTIRTNAKFHDGTPLTAEDIKASIERLAKGDLAWSMVVTPGISVTVTSPASIEVVSPTAFGVMLNALAVIKIIPKTYADNPDNFKVRALGSGPYKFVSYTGSDVVLEANPDYWGGAPKIKSVTFRFIEDAQARISALLSGQIDILTRASSEDLSRVEGNADFYVNKKSPPSQIIYIYQHNGPLKDLKLRQAMAYAIDREAIANSIMKGVNPVGSSSLPTNSTFYTSLEPKFEYNPEKAKALLAESAYPNGVTLRMSSSTQQPHQLEIDQVIAASLEAIGIKVEIERQEIGAYRTTYNSYDININNIDSYNNDPDFLFATYTGGTGEAVFHYSDPKFDELLAVQRAATPDVRAAAVTAAAQYLWDNQVTLYLSDLVWHSIVNKRIEGYVRASLIGEPLLPMVSVAG